MPSEIKNRRVLASTQVGFRKEVGKAYTKLGQRIAGVILFHADHEDKIPLNKLSRVQAQTGAILSSFFVGMDGRSPFAEDGTTPLAEFPRILNKWIGMSVGRMVLAHTAWMQKNVPEDVLNWLSSVQSRDVPIKEIAFEIALSNAEIDALLLFRPNPLAKYETAHTWVDPNGYILSDRIWRTSVKTRTQLDAMVADGIREGKSATRLAKEVEQFLHPNRAKIRTNKPYGKDASYDAMRLARTEITRAGNQAAYISAYSNPYVEQVDVARSANGDITCMICPQHATIGIGGERLREPYSVYEANLSPYHPHCMCTLVGVVVDPATVTQNLRSLMDHGINELPQPQLSPAQPRSFILQLLKNVIFATIENLLFTQP